jgi:hypothetical protein
MYKEFSGGTHIIIMFIIIEAANHWGSTSYIGVYNFQNYGVITKCTERPLIYFSSLFSIIFHFYESDISQAVLYSSITSTSVGYGYARTCNHQQQT